MMPRVFSHSFASVLAATLFVLIVPHGKLSAQLGETESENKAGAETVPAVEKVADGVLIRIGDSLLKVEVCADNVIRVAFAKDRAFFARKSLAAEPKRIVKTDWKLTTESAAASVSSAKLRVGIDLVEGAVSFSDANGK